MKRKIFGIIITVFVVVEAHAQANKVVRGNNCYLEQITKGVYAIIHENATDEWPHGNTGVIIGEQDVMVIDACYLPGMAREDIRLIKTVTNKPVKFLAFTHWHFDHNNGAIAYKETFPDITVISERESQKYIELNGVWWSQMCVAPNSTKRTSLADKEKALSSGVNDMGQPYSAAELDNLRKVIAQRKNELVELNGLKIVTPDKTFSGTMTIDLGKKKVVLTDYVRANSPHDVAFYMPDDQVLFTGDMLVQSPLPYVGASWPVTWAAHLHELEKITVTALVPGHGPVQRDHAYTKLMREFLESAAQQTEKMIREGKTLEQIQKSIDLSAFKRGPWKGDTQEFKEDWTHNSNALVERLWRCIRGQGGI
jgi:cyclase